MFHVSKDKKVEYWTRDEIKLILDNVKPHWRDHLEFLYHTGLRKAELINLTWDDVEESNGQISIVIQSKDEWQTKTHTRRVIPLSGSAVAIIRRQKRLKKHPYVFKGVKGTKVHHDRIYVDLKQTLSDLGLNGNIHKFRHTFASHLVMKGVGIETVSKLLGHSEVQMTIKYAHLADEHLKKSVDVLD